MLTNNTTETVEPMTGTKKTVFVLAIIFINVIILLLAGEAIVRYFNPQRNMWHGLDYSKEYGYMLPSDKKMVNSIPGKWSYTYHTNKYRYRGKPIQLSKTYNRRNLIILGDSNSFGMGVNDGEEFAAVMADKLQYNVINLAVPGWGLTQQIRRFYEFGLLYQPKVVILQFCYNDPTDNFIDKVTVVKDGSFVFQNTQRDINFTKKYLSFFFIQKSQLYKYFENLMFRTFKEARLMEQRNTIGNSIVLEGKYPNALNAGVRYSFISQQLPDSQIPEKESFYNELLQLFATDLTNRDIALYLFDVNGGIGGFEHIKNKVDELNSKHLLHVINIIPWFENVTDLGTPEGHPWGKKAHTIIGNNLSQIISRTH